MGSSDPTLMFTISNRWSLYELCHHNLELTHYVGVSHHVLLDMASIVPPQTTSILEL